MATGPKEIELQEPPTDTISSLSYSPDSNNLLLATSWDKHVYLYDTKNNERKSSYELKAAVLSGSCYDSNHGAAGGLDTEVQWLDLSTNSMSTLGEHEEAVSSLASCTDLGMVVSGSWDKTVRLWDVRGSKTLVKAMEQPGKVYCLSMAGYEVVVGLDDRLVYVWDLRQPDKPRQRRESSLKYSTKSLACFVDHTGYVLGSTEGRVAVEFLNEDREVQKKRYAFKCHRQKEDGQDVIYPVNTIAFHRRFGTFGTGGGDGIVNIWDALNKKRLCQLHRYQEAITALEFSNEGDQLAIGVSDDGTQGFEREAPPPAIFVRNLQDSECKPK